MDKKLPSSYDLWLFDVEDKQETNKDNFLEKIKKTINIHTLKDLTAFYTNFKKPKDMPKGCELYLFKEGIKPLWEDEKNKEGGSFFIHIKKTFANEVWDNFLTSIVSEEMPELRKINGIVLRVLLLEVVFYIWTAELTKEEEGELINWVKKTAGLSSGIKLEFKKHSSRGKKKEKKIMKQPEKPIGEVLTKTGEKEKKPFGVFDD